MKVNCELLFNNLSDAPNNTYDENEFNDSSNVLELSDATKHRRGLNKKYNTKCKLKMCIYASYCLLKCFWRAERRTQCVNIINRGFKMFSGDCATHRRI